MWPVSFGAWRCLARLLGLLTLLGALWCGPAQAAERRIALVVGNADYAVRPLENARSDAQDMARALSGVGFEVRLLLDADLRSLLDAVDRFGTELAAGGVGLFYYAGHGVQVEGRNYLLPIRARIRTENDARFEGLDAGRVLARMEEARNGLNIVILDACRDNPFASSFRSAASGLARMDAPLGTLLAFATAPGRTALDQAPDSGSPARNSVYTGALLRHLATPGLALEEVFKRTRADVVHSTGGRQVPWESSSLMGAFSFARGSASNAAPAFPPVPSPASLPGVAPENPRPENSGQETPRQETSQQDTATRHPSTEEALTGLWHIAGPDGAVHDLTPLLELRMVQGRLTGRIHSAAGTRDRVSDLRLLAGKLLFTWESQYDRYHLTSRVSVDVSGLESGLPEPGTRCEAAFRRVSGNWGSGRDASGVFVRAE